MMRSISEIKKTFVLQQDQSDCGVACLLSVINYYKGNHSLQKLREQSGTNTQGTTLLGLYQCAQNNGFDVEAFEGTIIELKKMTAPCILHVLVNEILQHYVVFYGLKNDKFIVGDPAKGIVELSENELGNIWHSKALLQLKPNEKFELKIQNNQAKWKWFKQQIKDDINILFITIILGVMTTILSLSTAIFSQKLIDQILPSGNAKKLITGLILLFLILLIKAGLGFIRQHFLLLQSKNFNNRMISSFFKSVVYLPKSFFDSRKIGDMITRMNDTDRIQKNIAYVSGTIFIDLIILITTSIFLVNYSLSIALVTFTFIPIIVVVILSYSQPIKQKQQDVMIANGLNESNYIDVITGMVAIKSHQQETIFTEKVNLIHENLQNKLLNLGKLGNKFSFTTEILSVLLSLVLISLASFFVLNKQLKIGEMIAVFSLTGTLIPAVSRLSQINLHLQEAKVAFDRMYDFSSVKPEYEQKKVEELVFEKLEVNHISFRFTGRKAILKDVSFELKKGEMIALLGESGCGKSTTMAILEKFYEVEQGSITINGEDLLNIYTPTWRNIVATVPQEIKLFNGTLIANISFGNTEEEIQNTIDFCKNMGFDNYFEDLPQSYFTLIGEEGINLSGGQKQLVALARALYKKPQVLLLDEATAAMDRNTENFILTLLKKLQPSMAILFITHKIQTAKISDRIYFIENGIVRLTEHPEELLKSESLYF